MATVLDAFFIAGPLARGKCTPGYWGREEAILALEGGLEARQPVSRLVDLHPVEPAARRGRGRRGVLSCRRRRSSTRWPLSLLYGGGGYSRRARRKTGPILVEAVYRVVIWPVAVRAPMLVHTCAVKLVAISMS